MNLWIRKNLLSVFSAFLLYCGATAHIELYAFPQYDNQTYQNLRNISLALEQSGRLEESIQLLLPYQNDPRVLQLLKTFFDHAGKKEAFLPLAEEAARKDPDSTAVLSVYFDVLAGVGLKDSLRLAVLRFVERAPDQKQRYLFAGGCLRKYQMFPEALALYDKGRNRSKRPEFFSLETAAVLIDLQRYGEALDELKLYLGSGAENGLSLAQREIYRIMESGDEGKKLVIENLSRMLKGAQNPLRTGLLVILVDANLTSGHSQPAFSGLRELISEKDKNEAFRYLTVFIGRCMKLENYPTALQAYELLDSLGILDKTRVLLDKTEIQLKMGRLAEVENSLVGISRDSQVNQNLRAEAMDRLGSMYLERLDKPDKALEIYQDLEKIDSARGKSLLEVKIKIAGSFIRLEKLPQAKALCVELLSGREDMETRSKVLLLLGHVYFYSGNMDSAETAYLTYAKLRLQEPEANDAIGRAYLIRNDNSPDFKISRMVAQALFRAHCGETQKAAEFFQKSLREAADSSYQAQIYFQMARVYEDAGEYPLALGAYEELVKKYSGHQLAPLAELRMGIILLESMGDKERARKHLERVVLEYPAGVATPEARRLLRSLEKNSS